MVWFAWLFGLGKALGLKPENIEALETAHFWINYGLFVGLGVSFLWRAIVAVFRGE